MFENLIHTVNCHHKSLKCKSTAYKATESSRKSYLVHRLGEVCFCSSSAFSTARHKACFIADYLNLYFSSHLFSLPSSKVETSVFTLKHSTDSGCLKEDFLEFWYKIFKRIDNTMWVYFDILLINIIHILEI